jgi:hypothetical protein
VEGVEFAQKSSFNQIVLKEWNSSYMEMYVVFAENENIENCKRND